jgi:hypothetical protein
LALATALWPLLAHSALAASAEYAIRWDPRDGGPGTIDEVAALLQVSSGKRKPKEFVVRYFALKQPKALPDGASVIARERTAGGETSSMF